MLSSVDCRSLLDHPAGICVVEIPCQNESLGSLLQLKQEGLINRLPLVRWPIVDPYHQMSFIGLIPILS